MQPVQGSGYSAQGLDWNTLGAAGQQFKCTAASFLNALEIGRSPASQEVDREVSQEEALERLRIGMRGVVKVALTFSYLSCYAPAQTICSLMGVAIIAASYSRGSDGDAQLPYSSYDGAMLAAAPSRWLLHLVQSALADFSAACFSANKQESIEKKEWGVKTSFYDLEQEIEAIFELKKENVTSLQKSVALVCGGVTAAAFAVNRIVFLGGGFIGGYLIASTYWKGAKEENVKYSGLVIALLPSLTTAAIVKVLAQNFMSLLQKKKLPGADAQ